MTAESTRETPGEPDPDITTAPDGTPQENPSGAAGDGEADAASGGAPEPPD
jgi:hypothetical protein